MYFELNKPEQYMYYKDSFIKGRTSQLFQALDSKAEETEDGYRYKLNLISENNQFSVNVTCFILNVLLNINT